MPKLKLTEKGIKSLAAPKRDGQDLIYWDSDLKGFGLKLSAKTSTRTYIVQRDLKNGKTRRLTVGAANLISLEKARQDAAEMLLELTRGNDPKAKKDSKNTLQHWLDRYIEDNPRLSEKTKAYYRDTVELHLEDWLDEPLASRTPEMIEDKHRDIAEKIAAREGKLEEKRGANKVKQDNKPLPKARGKEPEPRRNGQATANGAMRVFRLLWNYAEVRVKDLPRNPTKRLKKRWFPSKRRKRMVKADDLPVFYTALLNLETLVAGDYLRFILFTGMRRTEAASLRWDEIDFPNKVIRVPEDKTKAKRDLDLPMVDAVESILAQRHRFKGESEFVFPSDLSESGHIMEPKFFLRLVEKECGVAVSVHDLRRTFITTAESTNIAPLELKALVNHSLGSGVTEGYIHYTPERLRPPAQKVADRLKLLCGIAKKKAPTKKVLVEA